MTGLIGDEICRSIPIADERPRSAALRALNQYRAPNV
jgi:hypothetical protein